MDRELLSLNLGAPEGAGNTEPRERALAAGLGAGALALALSAIPRALVAAPFVPERVIEFVFAVMPIAVVEPLISILGPYAKRFAFLGSVVGTLVIFATIGLLFARRRPAPTLRDGLLLGAAVWLAASLTLVPALGGGPFGVAWRPNPWVASASLLGLGLVYGASFSWLLGLLGRNERLARRGASIASRRAIVQSVLGVGVAAIAFESLKSLVTMLGIGDRSKVRGGSGVFPDVDGLSHEITPVPDFYTISKNVFDPDGPVGDWRLEVAGMVERPRSYTLDELRALPQVEGFATLMCISNLVGGDLIGNAFWRGVSLGDILRDAGVGTGAVDLVFTAFDDYVDSIAIERALMPGTMLALEMNEAPLTAVHGSPLRAIVPGIYGMKNVKWIKRVEVVSRDVKGYWQSRGWDDTAEYRTTARIDVARSRGVGQPADVAGIAFAGDRGIARVEVSTDGGTSWGDAELRPALSSNAWVLWHFPFVPVRAGAHRVVARATDGRGDVQTEKLAPPLPKGSSGLHSVALTV